MILGFAVASHLFQNWSYFLRAFSLMCLLLYCVQYVKEQCRMATSLLCENPCFLLL